MGGQYAGEGGAGCDGVVGGSMGWCMGGLGEGSPGDTRVVAVPPRDLTRRGEVAAGPPTIPPLAVVAMAGPRGGVPCNTHSHANQHGTQNKHSLKDLVPHLKNQVINKLMHERCVSCGCFLAVK